MLMLEIHSDNALLHDGNALYILYLSQRGQATHRRTARGECTECKVWRPEQKLVKLDGKS